MDAPKRIQRSQLEQIAAKSLVNCHTVGVDSVLFDDTPGARVRAFVAQENHDLYRNSGIGGSTLSVALHSHHCDVVLKPVFGEVWNITPIGSIGRNRYAAWLYESQVTMGVGRFVRGNEDDDMGVRLERKEMKRSLSMSARQVHTIYVPRGRAAGWFVYEGAEDPEYKGMCWSDDDLSRFDFAPLYKPMSVDYLTAILGMLKVKVGS